MGIRRTSYVTTRSGEGCELGSKVQGWIQTGAAQVRAESQLLQACGDQRSNECEQDFPGWGFQGGEFLRPRIPISCTYSPSHKEGKPCASETLCQLHWRCSVNE